MLGQKYENKEGNRTMSKHLSNEEKRLYPRLNQKLPVKIAANGYDFATETKNISCIGAYCLIEKYIPPFTKVAVRLTLPLINDKKEQSNNVECKGVVVRTEDNENQNGFNIAIFFNEMKINQRQKISQYLNQILPKS